MSKTKTTMLETQVACNFNTEAYLDFSHKYIFNLQSKFDTCCSCCIASNEFTNLVPREFLWSFTNLFHTRNDMKWNECEMKRQDKVLHIFKSVHNNISPANLCFKSVRVLRNLKQSSWQISVGLDIHRSLVCCRDLKRLRMNSGTY